MRKALVLFLMLIGQSGWSQSVPRCWTADQPGAEIQEGLFRVMVPTEDHDAKTMAEAIALASYTLAEKSAVGSADDLSRLEIDLVGNLSFWRPSLTFPTLEAYKSGIVKSIEPLLKISGTTVECAPVAHRRPVP